GRGYARDERRGSRRGLRFGRPDDVRRKPQLRSHPGDAGDVWSVERPGPTLRRAAVSEEERVPDASDAWSLHGEARRVALALKEAFRFDPLGRGQDPCGSDDSAARGG